MEYPISTPSYCMTYIFLYTFTDPIHSSIYQQFMIDVMVLKVSFDIVDVYTRKYSVFVNKSLNS